MNAVTFLQDHQQPLTDPGMTQLPVFHLTVGEARSLIFFSQVVKPMSFLAQQGLKVSLAMVCPFGDFVRPSGRAQWRRQGQVLDSHNLPWKRLPSFPSRMRAWATDRSVLASFLQRRLGRQTRFILHCRGTAATQLALQLRSGFPNLRIVSDCRGVDGPEHAEQRGGDVRPEWIGALENAQREALSQSDAILCVSEAMKRYLVDTWRLDAPRIGVIPCCYVGRVPKRSDPDVQAIREEYKFEGKMVLAHVASETPWQRIEDVARFCSMLAARTPNSHFLFLTSRPQRMHERLLKHGLATERSTILSVGHDAVAPHLAAADVGMLIRNHSLVSRVASPVKFGEYLSAGLPVVVTPGIGDYSDLVVQEDVGRVLPSIDVDESAVESVASFLGGQQQFSEIQARAREVAGRVLSWPAYTGVFRSAYALAESA